MHNRFLTDNWAGIPIILISLVLGTVLFSIAYIIISHIDKKFTPHLIIGLTIGILLATTSMNFKIVSIVLNGCSFPLALSSLFFPVLALSTDVLNEFYGKELAGALINGFFISQTIIFILTFWFIEIPSETIEMHNTFLNTFAMATRSFMASAVAIYLCNWVDIHVFCYLRKITNEKMLWLRIFGSTVVGLLLDIFIFTFVLFVGARTFLEIFQMMFISAFVRVTFSVLEVPFMYLLKWLNKKQIFLVDGDVADAK